MAGSNALAGAFSVLDKTAIAIAATSLCVLVLVLAWPVQLAL